MANCWLAPLLPLLKRFLEISIHQFYECINYTNVLSIRWTFFCPTYSVAAILKVTQKNFQSMKQCPWISFWAWFSNIQFYWVLIKAWLMKALSVEGFSWTLNGSWIRPYILLICECCQVFKHHVVKGISAEMF